MPNLVASKLSDRVKGQVLLEELNCVACHASDSSLAKTSKVAPRLAAVGSRVNPYYLERFLRSPQATKPGTTMPDVMSHLSADEKLEAAKTLTHYLLSLDRSAPFQLSAIDSVAAEHGEKLFHSIGCAACHSPRNAQGLELLTESSVPLGALEEKYRTTSLTEFLRAPHKTRPASRMPDLRLNDREAEQLANYLLRGTKVPGHLQYTLYRGRVWEGLDENVTKEKAGLAQDFGLNNWKSMPDNSAIVFEGYLQLDQAGEYQFFLALNGGTLWLNGEEVAQLQPSNRRGIKTIEAKKVMPAGWNKIKLIYVHTGKDPSLQFEMAGPDFKRQSIPAERLSISQLPIESFRPYLVDKSLVAAGKQNFVKFGCAKCHNDVQAVAESHKPLSELDVNQGCLSRINGAWPQFALSSAQRESLRSVLPKVDSTSFEPKDIVSKTLVTFNCIACHERVSLGGVSPERDAYFVGMKKELGNEGRIPPTLTHVGAKLTPQWIKEVLLNGQKQREYLATRMPHFGEANVGHLVDLFEQVDHLEKVPFAEIDKVEEYKTAGHKLIGATGFSCIACHDFNGQKAGGPGALDIVHATQRIKKEWFYLFLLEPARFHPGTIMPASWPGGHVFKQDLLGGDAKKQIESIWIYLEDGRRAKNPEGLSRKSPELRVTDEPVICRGRGNAGFRGIAVGYPERVNLAFDSQEMNLRMLWKGDFATVDDGAFSARGSEQISFPPGIPFHRLKSLEDNWPYKRPTDYLFPQDHGYQFRGYFLDQKKRPTFMYRYGEINVEELFEDLVDKQQAYFRRTFTFDSPGVSEKFYLRVASGQEIHKRGADDTSFVADRLHITVAKPYQGILRAGEPMELLIPIELPRGKSKLALEYKW